MISPVGYSFSNNVYLNSRKKVNGIGVVLTSEHVGKKMFRTCPAKEPLDWSKVPDKPTLEYAKEASVTIEKITPTAIFYKNNSGWECSLPSEWNDGNWLPLEDFEKYKNA